MGYLLDYFGMFIYGICEILFIYWWWFNNNNNNNTTTAASRAPDNAVFEFGVAGYYDGIEFGIW